MRILDTTDILILTVGIIICFILVTILVALYLNYKTRKELNNIKKQNISLHAVIDDSIPQLLDEIIDSCFQEYQITHLIARDEVVITDEREIEIRNDLVALVSSRISPTVLERLSLRWNEKAIAEVIANRIYITVMNYVIQHNQVVIEQEIQRNPETLNTIPTTSDIFSEPYIR